MTKPPIDNSSSPVDMSPEAVDQRLRDLSQLFKLGMSIRRACRLGKTSELADSPQSDQTPNRPSALKK